MSRKYSKEIAAVISDFLTCDDWHFNFDEDRGCFEFGLSIKRKIASIKYRIFVGENNYVAYANPPINAPCENADVMKNMAELIARINYGIEPVNFEMDMNDGEIRIKNFVDCAGTLPSKQMVSNSIHAMGILFSRYADGIADVIFGYDTPENAVRKCENPENN